MYPGLGRWLANRRLAAARALALGRRLTLDRRLSPGRRLTLNRRLSPGRRLRPGGRLCAWRGLRIARDRLALRRKRTGRRFGQGRARARLGAARDRLLAARGRIRPARWRALVVHPRRRARLLRPLARDRPRVRALRRGPEALRRLRRMPRERAGDHALSRNQPDGARQPQHVQHALHDALRHVRDLIAQLVVADRPRADRRDHALLLRGETVAARLEAVAPLDVAARDQGHRLLEHVLAQRPTRRSRDQRDGIDRAAHRAVGADQVLPFDELEAPCDPAAQRQQHRPEVVLALVVGERLLRLAALDEDRGVQRAALFIDQQGARLFRFEQLDEHVAERSGSAGRTREPVSPLAVVSSGWPWKSTLRKERAARRSLTQRTVEPSLSDLLRNSNRPKHVRQSVRMRVSHSRSAASHSRSLTRGRAPAGS